MSAGSPIYLTTIGSVYYDAKLSDFIDADVLESPCQMYADDTKLFSNAINEQLKDQIQRQVDNLVEWGEVSCAISKP